MRVELSPILRRQYYPAYDPAKGLVLEDAAGKHLGQIVEELGIPLDEVSSTLVNYRVEEPGYRVKDGDVVVLTIAISGG